MWAMLDLTTTVLLDIPVLEQTPFYFLNFNETLGGMSKRLNYCQGT
jgi:hypothetical protein